MKINKKLLVVLTIALLVVTAFPALAQYGLNETANSAGLKNGLASKSVPEIVGSVIGVFLGLLGVIFLILMLYGGYLWMTSFGGTEKVKKAKDLLVDAAIGLIIVLAAYAITTFVIGALVTK